MANLPILRGFALETFFRRTDELTISYFKRWSERSAEEEDTSSEYSNSHSKKGKKGRKGAKKKKRGKNKEKAARTGGKRKNASGRKSKGGSAGGKKKSRGESRIQKAVRAAMLASSQKPKSPFFQLEEAGGSIVIRGYLRPIKNTL